MKSKKLKIMVGTMLILLIILLTSTISIASRITLPNANYNDSDQAKRRDLVWETYNKAYIISDDKSETYVRVLKDNPTDSSGRISTLALPNVYCVNHGVSLPQGWYQVESRGTASPTLAYILAHGPQMGTIERNKWNKAI